VSVGSDWNPAAGAYVDLEKQSLDIWALILRRKWLIVFMLGAGLALGYLYYQKATPVYETAAQVLVTNRQTDAKSPLNPMNIGMGYEDDLLNHAMLIKAPVIVQQAVEKYRLNELTSFANVQAQNVATKIIGDLDAIRAGGPQALNSRILQIKYRSTNVVDAMTVVKAIIRSYQDFLGETYQSVSDDTVRLMTEAKDELGAELKKKRDELRKFIKEAPGGTDRGEGQLTNAEKTKEAIETKRQGLDSRRAELRALLKTVETAQAEGRPIDAVLQHIEDYRKTDKPQDGAEKSFTDVLFPLLLEHQQLSTQYGPSHPRVKEAELKIAMVQQHIEALRLNSAPTNDTRKTPEQLIATILESARLDLVRLENIDKEFAEQQARAEKDAQYMQDFRTQFKVLNDEIKSIEDLNKLVLDRFKQINLVRDAGGITTRMVAPPDFAWQVEPKILNILSVAGFIGLAIGMGLAYLVDMADKSFRNPEEVRHELGVPILGHLPVIEQEGRKKKKKTTDLPSSVADIVCTHHRPKTTYSEAYRAVRTALNFGIRGEGHKVIQVTSPDPGDGKSTLSANLAVCMAQSGRRVLLVDADFRRPRVHRLFGIDAGVGMSAVIKGTADLPEVVVPTEIDNLFILPCGPRPSNPSELLSSTRFSELIHVLREQYDIVIIDTPPVLAVTDPCVVAPRVDGVVLLIRITKHVRPHAKRALESLESLGANLIGIVVNGVGGHRPGMGYGFGSQYGYRYATNSGYYDSYSYNYGGYHHYYDDGGETPTEEQVLRNQEAARQKTIPDGEE
jgi:succinoglycan biosynthesis transport protein ExoP